MLQVHQCESICVCLTKFDQLSVPLQVMSCPGGCIGGGGQPKTKGPDVLQRRMAAVYSIDSNMHLRKSHENPQIKVRCSAVLGTTMFKSMLL